DWLASSDHRGRICGLPEPRMGSIDMATREMPEQGFVVGLELDVDPPAELGIGEDHPVWNTDVAVNEVAVGCDDSHRQTCRNPELLEVLSEQLSRFRQGSERIRPIAKKPPLRDRREFLVVVARLASASRYVIHERRRERGQPEEIGTLDREPPIDVPHCCRRPRIGVDIVPEHQVALRWSESAGNDLTPDTTDRTDPIPRFESPFEELPVLDKSRLHRKVAVHAVPHPAH